MTDNFSSVSLRFAAEFEIQLYGLSKKYRNIRSDIEPILKQLQSRNFLGDRLVGFGSDNFIYKLRVKKGFILLSESGIFEGIK